MILLHGRGGSAEDILSLSAQLDQRGLCFLAPQAAANSWYPNRFIAPIAANEPHLTSALETVDSLVAWCADILALSNVYLLGFSQGACLALEYAARHPRRYGGIFALSGALIENGDTKRDYDGSLDSTPIFLGCSDIDFHIPLERVRRSSKVLQMLGAHVTERIYPGMAHTVNADEIAAIDGIVHAPPPA